MAHCKWPKYWRRCTNGAISDFADGPSSCTHADRFGTQSEAKITIMLPAPSDQVPSGRAIFSRESPSVCTREIRTGMCLNSTVGLVPCGPRWCLPGDVCSFTLGGCGDAATFYIWIVLDALALLILLLFLCSPCRARPPPPHVQERRPVATAVPVPARTRTQAFDHSEVERAVALVAQRAVPTTTNTITPPPVPTRPAPSPPVLIKDDDLAVL